MNLKLRGILLNIYYLRRHYIPLALLCLMCSVIGMFVLELLQGAILLKDASNIPYSDYYLVTRPRMDYDRVYDNPNRLHLGAFSLLSGYDYYENVDDAMLTILCSADANLHYFKKDLSVSDTESGSFPWTVVPDSEYDDGFRDATRYLTEGRHIQRGDDHTAILDIELAEINNIHTGDSFTSGGGDTYTVVGLFRSIKINPVITVALDVPHNMLYVSDSPTGSTILDTYNLYVSFSYPYSKAKIERFSGRQEIAGSDSHGNAFPYIYTSVDEINKTASNGVTSMLQLSVCCVVIMLIMIFVSLYSFISVFNRKRRREFILYSALGKKKRSILLNFSAEIFTVIIPSALIGIIACNLAFLRYLKSIISYFEKMVSVDTIYATGTLSLNKTESFSTGLFEQLENSHFLPDSLGFLAFFVLITAVCLIIVNSASSGWSVMKMFSEK